MKNQTIKSYNIRKQFKNKDELNQFIKFSGEKSINIDFDEERTISIFHEDYKVDIENLTIEIRIKRFQTDNLTPRTFKMYNFKTKIEESLKLEDLMKFYETQGFEHFNKVYSLEEKLQIQQNKKEQNKNV